MTDASGPIASAQALAELRESLVRASESMDHQVLVCAGTGCAALGAEGVYQRFLAETRTRLMSVRTSLSVCSGGEGHTLISETGCQGLCQAGPLIQILPQNTCYFGVRPQDVPEIVERTLIGGEVIPSLLYRQSGIAPEDRPLQRDELPFYKGQLRSVLKGCGHVTPDSIESYIAHGGFAGLTAAIEMEPGRIIDAVAGSGLRGRGGAGFPTGEKWRRCAENASEGAYVICNGDEGDPGAFMDLSIMEGDPFRVLEGMMICARAVGAEDGYIYVRNEYPRAVKRMRGAVEACRTLGLLGSGILGTDFDFDIRVVRGGGAFVCGESSALMQSIEGRVGEPRTKYVRSTKRGLFGKPTVLNNVETFACIPQIALLGDEAFRAVGTETSPGTKAFCLVGKVRNTGLVEVPMGTSLREVIFEVGGGMMHDRPFKAVQTGGPTGGCLDESGLDTPLDFDALKTAGALMGSGGIIVMDDRTCMVDTAKYFIRFLLDESCGKCTPCREGLAQLDRLLEAVTCGRAELSDLERIERIAEDMRDSALCGLGKSAPNPVLSCLAAFRAEFEAHILEKRCLAGVCPDLTAFHIDETKCNGCGLCVSPCPTDAITGDRKKPHAVDSNLCIQCGACRETCRRDAIWTSGK